jgi:hypothetical protein
LRFLAGDRAALRIHEKTRPEDAGQAFCEAAVNRNSEYNKYDPCGGDDDQRPAIRAYRPKEGDPAGPKSWQRLRKGVSDLYRRTEISQQSNERYLECLAAVDTPISLGEVVGKVCQPTHWQKRRVRALQPLSQADGPLLAAVARGEFAVNGFRNRDLRALLDGEKPSDPAAAKRQAARITRQLRLLRGHGLIRKIPKTHRYQLTPSGRTTITALLVAQQTNIQHLAQLAA